MLWTVEKDIKVLKLIMINNYVVFHLTSYLFLRYDQIIIIKFFFILSYEYIKISIYIVAYL